MIPQALPANTPQKTAGAGAAPDAGKASAFELLMQQTTALQSPEGLQASLQTGPQTGLPTEAAPELTLPEGIDPDTAEGLVALLDHIITELENGGEQLTSTKVLAEFAEALGAEPALTIGELAAVAQFADTTLEATLTERIANAVQTATPISQLSIAAAGVPAVDRSATPKTEAVIAADKVNAAATTMSLRDLSNENRVQETPLAMNSPDKVIAKDAAIAVPGQPGTVVVDGARDLSQAAGSVQLPPEIHRSTPTAERMPAPSTAADVQLRQHVAQQIRTVETGDSKFRFSLSPYGMGEIEVEIGRSENGRVQISMVTETASVLNVLRQDREQLLDALQSRGIAAENSDLDFQTFGERGRNDQQQPENGLYPDHTDAQVDSNEPVQVQGPSTGTGLLDILT
ncbi:flagellar hook-length control protein FliK [uncultured Sulfitobacter sp.]|uniref:flagellar hook-length control protein FliK n=1 Tax=uncultured Sulfitobacter sp. TaxID=191468 RepID=UPI0030D819FB|tara:strand:+ start:19195 stop:20397 length:1203 start_codon:yes stop_codon:yes gene_type:complete